MRFALCTSIYEAGRPFLADWIAAARTAGEGHDVCAVVAVDDFKDAEEALEALSATLPTITVATPEGAGIAGVRAAMLRAGCNSGADILVFCDMDDRLYADALAQHACALEQRDFSFGDMRIINENGERVANSFLSGSAIPEHVTRIENIIDRNWLGFSNTAVRVKSLPDSACNVPESVIAVDWWLFSQILRAGGTGRRANGIIADYRMYDGNLLGAGAATSTTDFKRRCEIVRRHYEALGDNLLPAQRLRAVETLIARLDGNADPALEAAITTASAQPRVWHEDVSRMLAAAGTARGRTTAVQLPNYVAPSDFVTRQALASELRRIGIEAGDTILLHLSLASLGFVIGGTRTVLDALYDALGEEGTLMMPAFTGDLTDPATWFKPPVPEESWDEIRDALPAFDPKRTPCMAIGALAELFRNEPGTIRSGHPVSSFAARGPNAKRLLADHPLDERFGRHSPLGAFCALDGKVALIGAPYESMTLLHLSSYDLKSGNLYDQRSPILVDEDKRWVAYRDRSLSWQWFPDAVRNLLNKGIAHEDMLCGARTLVADAKSAAAETTEWRNQNNVH